MKQRTVYLAGPMEHVSIEDAKGWRTIATDLLLQADQKVLDPTRRVHEFQPKYMKRIFELDQSEVQKRKLSILNNIIPRSKRITYIEIDFNKDSITKKLHDF